MSAYNITGDFEGLLLAAEQATSLTYASLFIVVVCQWFDGERPETEPCPGQYRSLEAFPRLLVLRMLRPDRVPAAMEEFIRESIGTSRLGVATCSSVIWNVVATAVASHSDFQKPIQHSALSKPDLSRPPFAHMSFSVAICCVLCVVGHICVCLPII